MLKSQATTRRRRYRGGALLTVGALLFAAPLLAAKGKDKERRQALRAAMEQLPEKYLDFLESVEMLISDEEQELFLELQKDYQRDAFIERFWRVRDPYPGTARNELRESWDARLREAREQFPSLDDERAQILLIHGFPQARIIADCAPWVWPAEVWHYEGSDAVHFEFILLFYQPFGAGQYRIWDTFEGEDLLRERDVTYGTIAERCGERGRPIEIAIAYMLNQSGATGLGGPALLARLKERPKPPGGEWVATFSTYSTDLPDGAETFNAELQIAYPGRYQSRTVLQGNLVVGPDQLVSAKLGPSDTYNLVLGGEVLREGQLFENFRYRFDLPTSEVRESGLPLLFQRNLRPGRYTLIVKLEDVNGGRFHRVEREIDVPLLDMAPAPTSIDPETARLLAEANAAIRSGDNTIKILPLQGEWQTGLVRIDTMSTGDSIAAVTFFLDDRQLLTKKRPPYSVELDLGQVPRARVLRVEAYDQQGEEIAADERMINAGTHRFAIRLVEPRRGKTYRQSLQAQADVIVPEGQVVERVELYLNETRVATLFQPPYTQPIVLPEAGEIAYVRAVAYTPDGNSTEDLVFVNAPDYLEEIDVDFVELFVTVLDKGNRPVEGLGPGSFTVLENGARQEVVRFEQVRDLPIHVAVMLDISASMEEEIDDAQGAALRFFEQAVTPKDRAAIITFNDHPNLATKLTNDVESLAAGLAGLKAERGTALYDALIFTLYYFNGIKGQRAILLLSDGKDESSRFEFDDALEFSRRAGVAIYAVGLDLPGSEFNIHGKLTRLASETGGRSFFVKDVAELPGVYDAIQQELRSRYLLAYQSSDTSGSEAFRTVDVKVEPSGLEAKAMRGYYP